MTKDKSDNYHVIYLGEIPWNVPETPQADTRDTRFQLKLKLNQCCLKWQSKKESEREVTRLH